MKCKTCKHYLYYLWGYEDGSIRVIDSCRYLVENKEECDLYERGDDDE